MINNEKHTFIEWLDKLSKKDYGYDRMVFELKNWTFEPYLDNPTSFKLKCNICRFWADECECFERQKINDKRLTPLPC